MAATTGASRWEIESDNKRDKSGARLDQIRGETFASVITLVSARTRALLHGLAQALALNTNHQHT